MSRFARLAEEVLLRHKELAVEHHKTGKIGRGSLETLFLYECILVHSWETGVCKKTLGELCEIYDLDYDNSTRRAKTLRQKGWLENTKKHLRPLLIHRADDKRTVIITAEPKPKTVTVTAKDDKKTVTVTAENCNSYSKSDKKTVTVTAENAVTRDEISDSGDAMIFKDLKSKDLTTSSSNNNGHLSQFSPEECLAWIERRIENGEKIETPHKLARWAYQTGEMDAYISATLYPEPLKVEPTVEYDDEVQLLERGKALEIMLDMQASGLEIAEQRKWFTEEDWAWLMAEMENYVE